MYSEDELLPLSALQHLAFCERQWGLIHLEQIWIENRLTTEGLFLHERTDEPVTENRGDIRIARGLRIRSLRLGLSGRADVVEFHRVDKGIACADEINRTSKGVILEGVSGIWQPFPVEYKRGKPKLDHCDEIQLCAQALCIEEMLGASLPNGALYYGKIKRRYGVEFHDTLRNETEALSKRLHRLTIAGQTPIAQYAKKCESCSLMSYCMPETTGIRRSTGKYLRQVFTMPVNGDNG